MYRKCFKRLMDFCLSLVAMIILSPILLLLCVAGAVKMKGNPFFVQPRPGKGERIFKLVKFRTMNSARNKDGELLPDEQRLTGYGKFLRGTSLDELPELWNIIKGDMSIVGPRPLLVSYLPLYSDEQKRRHEMRPGLTGLAQVNGRNAISWQEKFRLDVQYIETSSFMLDLRIILLTIKKVFAHEGINQDGEATMTPFTGNN